MIYWVKCDISLMHPKKYGYKEWRSGNVKSF
ncbi:hypothetical protein BGLA2_260090 [Burkholderia gladioli]|nr:hypothetical protein BGLA2_260090 [Burkholderia gladioli]